MRGTAGTSVAGLAGVVARRAGRLELGVVDRAYRGRERGVISSGLALHMGMTTGERFGRDVVPGHVVHRQQAERDRQNTQPQQQLPLQASEMGAMHKSRLAALARNTQGGYVRSQIAIPH